MRRSPRQADTLEAMQQRHAEVTRTLIELSGRARQQSDDFGAQMARRRCWQQAPAEGDGRGRADRGQRQPEARAAVSEARAQAAKLLTEAGTAEAQKVEQLRSEIAGLERRKKALVDALRSLSSSFSSSVEDFHGEDEAASVGRPRRLDGAETAVLDAVEIDEVADTAVQPAITEDDDATRVQPAATGGQRP
ncbi:MAG: hypothetical protein R2719_13655 [Micropruina sp.]